MNNNINELDYIIKKDCKPYKDYSNFFIFLGTQNNPVYFLGASIFSKKKYYKYSSELIEKINKNILTNLEKACIGSMYGMAIGDAIGARLEFLPLDYKNIRIFDIGNSPGGAFQLEPGQWTDDTSMGLCLCDSLIEKNSEFDPKDIMMRFILWWFYGYNNCFRFDIKRKNKHSVGLGGNISGSITEYIKNKGTYAYTNYGNKKTSGNGSIMRNAAIPLCYFRNEKKALEFAEKQSLITHQGEEAAGCCQLMTFIIIKILNLKIEKDLNNQKELDKKNNSINNPNFTDISDRKEITPEQIKNGYISDKKEIKTLKEILDDLGDFNCKYNSVNYLAKSLQEGNDKNRNWNWKDQNFKYSEERAKKEPRYIGSYCMDGLAMALHVLYTTNNFIDAILKAVNLCGDADSVGSVVGQIAGAYYQADSIPTNWINIINKWDNYEIALRGYILCHLNEKKEENNFVNNFENNKNKNFEEKKKKEINDKEKNVNNKIIDIKTNKSNTTPINRQTPTNQNNKYDQNNMNIQNSLNNQNIWNNQSNQINTYTRNNPYNQNHQYDLIKQYNSYNSYISYNSYNQNNLNNLNNQNKANNPINLNWNLNNIFGPPFYSKHSTNNECCNIF